MLSKPNFYRRKKINLNLHFYCTFLLLFTQKINFSKLINFEKSLQLTFDNFKKYRKLQRSWIRQPRDRGQKSRKFEEGDFEISVPLHPINLVRARADKQPITNSRHAKIREELEGAPTLQTIISVDDNPVKCWPVARSAWKSGFTNGEFQPPFFALFSQWTPPVDGKQRKGRRGTRG